ncbi:MAG: glutamine synthetase family protein [Muribaculaceae bacterium]|nr:glutamine synthetase family protein [Muribaculaceae bacterium]
MNTDFTLHKNEVVRFLKKDPRQFTREDIVKYVEDNGIEMINFMYPAADGRLKTLNFIINDREYLYTILASGERVDGSSLFPFIEAGSSDLYVIPRYSTAFKDPFTELPTLTMLCSFFDKDGQPLASAPEMTLRKACEKFRETTGLDFHAMGELEYYVITPEQDEFPACDQRGYHESAPFAKLNDFRTTCMSYIARTGGCIKYGHSEVGNFILDGYNYEQNEIEFLPVPAPEAADQLLLAKWVIRNLAYRQGLNVTFAPKITTGKAGSGLHIHMKLMRGDKNVMLNDNMQLSDDARRMIAGLMTMAPSITAFGNTNPTSYFRLVPHQEAPTNICWGDRNRSVLVRVPLGWNSDKDMCSQANPQTPPSGYDASQKQTVEIRSADCSANVYYLLAALAVAARHGFETANALDIAEDTYVDVNIHAAENADKLAKLNTLPTSCAESAEALEAQRGLYEAHDVFPSNLINRCISQLKAFNDETLSARAANDTQLMKSLIKEHFHCG